MSLSNEKIVTFTLPNGKIISTPVYIPRQTLVTIPITQLVTYTNESVVHDTKNTTDYRPVVVTKTIMQLPNLEELTDEQIQQAVPIATEIEAIEMHPFERVEMMLVPIISVVSQYETTLCQIWQPTSQKQIQELVDLVKISAIQEYNDVVDNTKHNTDRE